MMDDAGQATIDDSIIEASEHDSVVVNNEAIHLLLQDASSPGNDSPLIVNTDTSLPLDDHGVGANDTDNNLVSVQSIVSNVQSSLSDLINPSVQTITTSDGSLLEPGDMILQAVTLADGSTAYIERPYARANEQLSETTLGTVSITSTEDEAAELKFIEGQAIQLEDGSRAYIHSAPKDGMQAIQLDDGTTAYISHAQVFGQMTEQLEESVAIQSVPSTAIVEKDGIILPSEIGSVSVVRNRLPSDRALALGEKAYRCNYVGCGRLYTTPHHLKVHERSHTGDRPFQCDSPNCGKAFATSYGLKSHTRVHTGEKPYKCPEMSCSKAFKTSGDLQKHIRTHTGERPFKCPFEGCERSFTTSNIRKVHIRTHTGERPYVCDMEGCNKSFASATNYKNHVRIHSGEKPYVCTVEGCNKRFTEYSSLYKHHVVHTHSKPYICNHCGKTYRQTSTLAMHRRTIHGDDSPLDAEVMLGPDGPSPKRRMTFSSVQSTNLSQGESSVVTADDGDGNLIINTSDPPVTMMSADTLVRMVSNNEPTMVAIAANSPVLQQIHAGMAGHEGSQILLVADASQLHLLQQLAQQPNANTFTINTQAVASGLQIQGHHHHNHHHQHTPAVKVQPVETSALAVITNNPTGLSSFTLSSTATLNTTAPPVDDSDCLHVSNEPPDDVKSDDLDGLRLHDDGVIL